MPKYSTINELFPSRFLKVADIHDSDLVVTIATVGTELVGQDREEKPVVTFVETKKILVLNKTNANTITQLYGENLSNWGGKRIALYTTEVDFAGKTQLGIRIRLRVPDEPTPAFTVSVS